MYEKLCTLEENMHRFLYCAGCVGDNILCR